MVYGKWDGDGTKGCLCALHDAMAMVDLQELCFQKKACHFIRSIASIYDDMMIITILSNCSNKRFCHITWAVTSDKK